MDDDLHFSRYRAEHARRLDADYRAWLEERRSTSHRDAAASSAKTDEPRNESPLESLGRAVSETVTGALPEGDRGTGKAR